MAEYKAIAADLDLLTHTLIDGECRSAISSQTFDTINLVTGKALLPQSCR